MTMQIRKTDTNGDWTFGEGTSNYIINLPALLQWVSECLQIWKNDLYWSTDSGVDWENLLGGGVNDYQENIDLIEQDCRLTIMQQQQYGVIGVITLDTKLNRYTRMLTITYQLETIYGISDPQQVLLDFYGNGTN